MFQGLGGAGRERLVGLLWVLGGLLPFATLAWAVVERGALPPLPEGTVAPVEPGVELVAITLAYAPFAFIGASLAMGPAAAPIAWVMLVTAAVSGLAAFAGQYATHGLLTEPGSLPGAEGAAVVACLEIVPNVLTGALLLMMLPTGRLPGPPARRLAVAALVVGGAILAAAVLRPGPLRNFGLLDNPIALPGLGTPLAAAVDSTVVLWPACVAAIAVWLMRTAAQDGDADRRRLLVRIGWLAIAISASGTFLGVTGSGDLVWIPALLLFALLVELTVLTARHERLWGLPSLLHRTVLWLASATVLALAYAAAVGLAAALGSGLDGVPRWIAIAAAIAVAAVARSSLDGWGRRALVGEGADPGRAVLGLVRRVEAVTDVREAPRVVVDGVSRAVHAAHVSLDVVADGRLVPAAEAGSSVPGDRLAIPLVHAGVTVGVLAVTVPRGERLGDPEQALVRDLCVRAAPVVDAFRLTRQLEDDRTRRAAALAEARAGAEQLLRGHLLSRLDAIAAELRVIDRLDPAQRSSALAGIDREVARMLHGVRSLAHDLASPRS